MRRAAKAAAVAAISTVGAPLLASGEPPPAVTFIDSQGGTPAELARFYAGRLPVVLTRAPDELLYLDWRLLHRLPIGQKAGKALFAPCCETVDTPLTGGSYGWLDDRKRVEGAPELSYYYLPVDRPGPDYTSIPNCFPDAFDSASATLKARIARYGAKSAAVKAWLATQDAVFDACANPAAALPPLTAHEPQWLAKDRAYQEAAFALYNFRNAEAAERFGAIARDSASPWRGRGLYLRARALFREALARPGARTLADADSAVATLAAAPPGTYGRDEAADMKSALDYREHPAALLQRLDRELGERTLSEYAATGLVDYLSLARSAEHRPDAADWMLTLRAEPAKKDAALAHSRARWSASRDPAWLVAALSFADPGSEAAGALLADADAVPRGDPAWLTVQYHRLRLTLGGADADQLRRRLDSILADPALTAYEWNLFSAMRTEVAADLGDLARHSIRRPYCPRSYQGCFDDAHWVRYEGSIARGAGGAWFAFGPDARAIADRLPLDERIRLSRDASLPTALRLDLALTSFARAVQLRRDAAIDALARELVPLLPQLRGDWRAILAARPGPDKRFATFFAMAKLPGLRSNLVQYQRPQGGVSDFPGYWVDWTIPARPGEPAFPREGQYGAGNYYWYAVAEGPADLLCVEKCGLGAAPLRLPPFVQPLQARAGAEQGFFVSEEAKTYRLASQPPAPPPSGLRVWEELLGWARAHPRDPRSPQAFYWLIHIGRWSDTPGHIGRRAFALLHARYPRSVWAERAPYYYD
ncbi:MAG: hypothetical protein QOE79_1186 [Sphingomonadales bacterium]|jgi:hypothetical protein|nr:hypothetical protein [Sphingomonadales bacterium]MEA3050704.1 hypothetical protein [Sphingomonadales bacterium]